MASISTGLSPFANESGSSGSFSLRLVVVSDLATVACFLGCPWRTNFEIEKDTCLLTTAPLVAVWYSSRMWCKTFRTVFPTECSWFFFEIDGHLVWLESYYRPLGWASTNLRPTPRMISTNCSKFENLAFEMTWRKTSRVSNAVALDPTICLKFKT